VLKALAVFKEDIWQGKEVDQDANGNDYWSKEQSDCQLNNVLSFILLSVVHNSDKYGVGDHLKIKKWNNRNNQDASNNAVKYNHDDILEFKKEVTGSCTSKDCNGWNKRQHEDVDWEESDCNGSKELVIGNTILQSDDVESSVGLKVLPDLLVFIDEHSCEE
jgi:hypothetical protein